MNNTNYLYINNFSKLHNNKNIFFCKTDYILQDFKTISQLNNDVIFITGNSDYAITDELVSCAPKNIKKWYCQNALSNHSIIEPLPIGLENITVSIRNGHGVAYTERASIRENLIDQIKNTKATIENKIYANFNIHTNAQHRGLVKEACLITDHIVWDEWHGDLNNYYTSISDYSMILCPAGNGVDTHRLWEMLYCNKIPIVIKLGNYKIYELYQQLPIILLDNIQQLYDNNLIKNLYSDCCNKVYQIDILDIDYWISNIREESASL